LPTEGIGKNLFVLWYKKSLIEGHDQLKSYITNYYKGLFGAPAEGNFSLDEARTDDVPQVSDDENNFLTAPNSEDEIRKTVFQMEHNKAPGPDGFPAEFYQYFWDVIKSDLLDLFADLHAGQLELFRLNFGVFYWLRLMKQKGFNNIDLSTSLMLALKFSLRLAQLG
jgi:hypothetical protein